MAKDTFYFQHDYNARNDPKILELRSEYGMEGYGVYWCIIETLAEDENSRINPTLIGGLSVGYGIPKARLTEIVNFMLKIGLLREDETGYFSVRMDKHKNERKHLSDKGKEGAAKRWGNSPPIAPPNAKERKGKERKEKENKEEEKEEEKNPPLPPPPPPKILTNVPSPVKGKPSSLFTYEQTINEFENSKMWLEQSICMKYQLTTEYVSARFRSFLDDQNTKGQFPRDIFDTKEHFHNVIRKEAQAASKVGKKKSVVATL